MRASLKRAGSAAIMCEAQIKHFCRSVLSWSAARSTTLPAPRTCHSQHRCARLQAQLLFVPLPLPVEKHATFDVLHSEAHDKLPAAPLKY